MPRACSVIVSILGLLLWIVGSPCYAQTSAPPSTAPVQGSLVDLINSRQYDFNALERLSATANQASYNALLSKCMPDQSGPAGSCTADDFVYFMRLRQLVQTANALLGNGKATRYSLNLTNQGLGNALRWTASEELSAPGSAASQFTNAQFASVASRLAALRFGATGFSVAGISSQTNGEPAVAAIEPQMGGGGASADSSDIGSASRWGGFLNGAFGWGKREPTVLEDAFAFDSRAATLGIDYRMSRRLVLGAAAGYTNQRIEFDSSLSVVDGEIHSHGYSLQVFGLYEWDGPYVSLSLGAQRAHYDSKRLITYPSLSPFISDVPPVDALASGSTTSTSLTSTFEVGWTLSHRGFGFEPYLSGDYQHIHLEGFSESSVNIGVFERGQKAGFDLAYAAQRISLLDSALGTRFQYTFSPPFGVAVAFVKAEYHHIFDNHPGTVVSSYNAIVGSGAAFNIPSDRPDPNFFQFAVGSSFVFRHGIQAYLQYQTSAGITNVSTHLISGGFRGAF